MADPITEKNIGEAEKETIRVANSTLSALESALAAWEEAKVKPEELKEKFSRYALLRDALAEWMTRMLRAQDDGLQARQKRLAEFASICRRYSEGS